MNAQTRCTLSQLTSNQIFETILNTGRITRDHQKALLRMLCWENPITPEDQKQIKQVFHRLDMGLLKVSD
jgi:hypothetical protein